MSAENSQRSFITYDLPMPENRQGMVIPDYSEELSFGPMFSGLRRIGGNWTEEGNLLKEIFPDPGEEVAGAAVTHWLALQEKRSVSEMAPVMPFYADLYSEELFENRIRSNREYYDAIRGRLDEIQEAADEEDDTLADRRWREEHPFLAPFADFVNGMASVPFGHIVLQRQLREEEEERGHGPRMFDPRGLIAASSDMNPMRPVFDSVVEQDEEGRFRPNYKGLGTIAGGVLAARLTPFRFDREHRLAKVSESARGRMLMMRDRVEYETGARYDPDTKAFYKNGQRLSDEETRGLLREKKVDLYQKSEFATAEDVSPADRVEPAGQSVGRSGKPSLYPDKRLEVEREAIKLGLQDRVRIHDSVEGISDPADGAFKLRAKLSPETNAGYVPGQGRIHVLLNRLGSLAEVRKVLRHEALHVLFRSTMKKAYEGIRHRARLMAENDLDWERISARYKGEHPDVVLEEYVVYLIESGKNLPVRRAFTDEMKRLARTRFGADFDLTEADVREFLNDTRKRIETRRIESSDASLSTGKTVRKNKGQTNQQEAVVFESRASRRQQKAEDQASHEARKKIEENAKELRKAFAGQRFVYRQGSVREAIGMDLTDEQIGDLAGAPGDSTIMVVASKDSISMEVNSKYFQVHLRKIHREKSGTLVLYNAASEKSTTLNNIGSMALLRQVKEAIACKFDRIETSAMRGARTNGYYSSPRNGFDGGIPEEIRNSLPREYSSANTIQELFSLPNGRAWWREKGDSVHLEFNLKEESSNVKILKAYLREGGIEWNW